MKFLPQQLQISSFGNGGFRFGSHSHLGPLLALPSGMRAWGITVQLVPDNFTQLLKERDNIDFVLIGTGSDMLRLPRDVVAYLAEHHLNAECMSTSSAVHSYNVMLAEGRRIAAGFVAVEKAVQ